MASIIDTPITMEQLERVFTGLRETSLEDRMTIPEEVANQALERGGFKEHVFVSLRSTIEEGSNTIIRRVSVDPARPVQEVLRRTRRRQYLDLTAVATMPHGQGGETYVHLFFVGRWPDDEDLRRECASRGLVAASPYALAAVNEVDPGLSLDHPNFTQWKDTNDKIGYMAFHDLGHESRLTVSRSSSTWRDGWWGAGVSIL